MKNKHKVVVFKTVDSNGNPEFRVEPGRLIASAGDTIVFKANRSIGAPTDITFASPIFAGRLALTINLNPGQSESRQLLADAAERAYPYVVSCTDARILAKGASEPEIIIDN